MRVLGKRFEGVFKIRDMDGVCEQSYWESFLDVPLWIGGQRGIISLSEFFVLHNGRFVGLDSSCGLFRRDSE